MSESPKFTVVDRRKFKAEEEQETAQPQSPEAANKPAEAAARPRLVESRPEPAPVPASGGDSLLEAAGDDLGELPPPPTAEESREQKSAYDASAQRLEDILRAQNPAMGAPETIGFEHLVQQFYVSAMIQMGAGTQEGQRPRIDILGARQTIDLLAVLAEKTRGNLSADEDRALQTVLFEARMAFLELTRMITLQSMQPPQPPPPGKR
jgi:hypothetical protein